MAITLFPNSERIQINEDKNDGLKAGLESYTGIVFDTEKNAFSIVTGKFRDKKDMYNRMTKQDKYLRRAYESKIFDWIQDNAETPVDGYLMLSTAVSKWMNNNVLSKYYKKLLHDLPYINREGRKGDPQTMGVDANFESAEDFEYEDILVEGASLGELEQTAEKYIQDKIAQEEPVKYYQMRVAGLDFIGAPVYNENGEVIGYVSNEYQDTERQSQTKNYDGSTNTIKIRNYIVKDNNGNNIGYYQKSRGKVYDSLVNGKIIGKTDIKDFIKPDDYYDFKNIEGTIPVEEYNLDPSNILKNPMLVVKALQILNMNKELRNNYSNYLIELRDKNGNFEQRYALNYNQLEGAKGQIDALLSGKKDATVYDKKMQEPAPMSSEEEKKLSLDQMYAKASRPSNIAFNHDMHTDIANNYDRIAKAKADNKKDSVPYVAPDVNYEKEIKNLQNTKLRAKKVIDTYKKKESEWKAKRDWAKEHNADRVRLDQMAKDFRPTSIEMERYQQALKDYKNADKELALLLHTPETQNEAYVNDGATDAMRWTDANYQNIATYQEASTHDELNQVLFDGKKLKEDVRQALLDIANTFKDDLKINYEPVDIYFTGSEANYNYNEDSDIDVHLVYDFENAGIVAEMIKQYLQTAKKVFNNNHNITVKGLPVEVGAEIKDTPLVTSGVYSLLNDSWVIEPENANKEIAEPTEPYYNEVKMRIKDAITSGNKTKLDDAITFIWDIRKNGLANEGEFGPANTLFKKLRSEGLLNELKKAYYDAESDDLSLESMMKEAEFNDKEESKKEITQDLFDKSEQEIVDGLMDHYEGNEDEAISKVEDVLKTVSDGYKDKLQNVITKIRENCSFGKKCRRLAEKILSEQDNEALGVVIKRIADKISSKYMKDNDGDFRKALNSLESDRADDKDILTDIELTDDEKDRLFKDADKTQNLLYTYAKNLIMTTQARNKIDDEIAYGKSQRNFVPNRDQQNEIGKNLKMPDRFVGQGYVNFYKDQADIPAELLAIREKLPTSLMDHPHAYYIVDDEGKRIALKGIENSVYPKEVWVNEIKSMPQAPTDKIIGHFNGQDVRNSQDAKIGYADEEHEKAYSDNGKFIGYIDKFGNVYDPRFVKFKNSAVKAYAMPLEKYIDILYNPRNAETLQKAIKNDPVISKLDNDNAKQYNYVSGKAKDIRTAKEQWILDNMEELQLDHYPAGVRDAIYNRVVKERENLEDVLSDYKTAYSKEPLMKVTPEVKNYLGVEESLEEDVLTEDENYYTVNNDFFAVKDALMDMGIPVAYTNSILKVLPKDAYDEAPKFYVIQGVAKNPNIGTKIQTTDPDLANSYIDAENRVIKVGSNNKPQVIGFAPQQTFEDYEKAGDILQPRLVFKYIDNNHEQMKIAGIVANDTEPMFKIARVNPETGKRLTKADGVTPEKPWTKDQLFSVLARDENSIENTFDDIDARADAGEEKARHSINNDEQQGEYLPLNDNEIEKVLNIMVSKNKDNDRYVKVYDKFREDHELTRDVMKVLREYDPKMAKSLRANYKLGTVSIYLPFLDKKQDAYQPKKTAINKIMGK